MTTMLSARTAFTDSCFKGCGLPGYSTYTVLNRRYKPLGSFTSEWVTYENDTSACAMTITPEIAKRLSWNGSEDTDVIHLYADGCLPEDSADHLRAYAERLDVFMTLKASTD